MSDGIVIELGDVINIQMKNEPPNTEPLLIKYIDQERIELLNIETEELSIIQIANGRLQDYEVEKITLLTRNPLKGYALQNGLTTGKNVRIGFIGVPEELVGEILEHKNDIITILLSDTLEIIYIDFAFKGLPNEVPLKYIEAFKPLNKNELKETSIDKIYNYLDKQNIGEEKDEETPVSINKLSEDILQNEDMFNEDMRPWMHRVIRKYIDKLNTEEVEREQKEDEREREKTGEEREEFGEPEGEAVIGMTEKSRAKLQYIVNEADRLMEEELYNKPTSGDYEPLENVEEFFDEPNKGISQLKYTPIYSLEEQVKDMLDDYLARIPTENRTPDVLNKVHNIIQRYTQLRNIYIVNPPIQYPLYDGVKNFDKSVEWIIPVVSQALSVADDSFLQELKNVTDQYNSEVDNRYEDYLTKIENIFSRMYDRNPEDSGECIVKERVGTDLAVVSNLEEKPYLTKYLSTEDICLLSILTLPFSAMRYSRIHGNITSIFETTNILEGTGGLQLYKLMKNNSFLNTVYVGGDGDGNGDGKVQGIVDKNYANNYVSIDKNFDSLLRSVLEKEINIKKYLKSIPYKTRGVGFSVYKLCRQLEPFQIYYDRLKNVQTLILKKMVMKKTQKYKNILKHNVDSFEKMDEMLEKTAKSVKLEYNMAIGEYRFKSNLDKVIPIYNGSYMQSVVEVMNSEFLGIINKIDYGELYNLVMVFDRSMDEFSLNRFEEEDEEETKIKKPNPFGDTTFSQYLQNKPAFVPGQPVIADKIFKDFKFPAPFVPPAPPVPQLNQIEKEPEKEQPLAPHFAKAIILPIGKTGKESCKNVEVVKIYIDIQDIHNDNDQDIIASNLPTPRPVMDKDYALLLDGKNTVRYFIRTNGKWREDVTIQSSTIYDSPSMFCNMGLWCVRDFTNKKCVPMQELMTYMVQSTLTQNPPGKINKEFDRYIRDNLKKIIDRTFAIKIQTVQRFMQYDYLKFAYGTQREFVDIVISPHLDLFLVIMADPNFGKRQQDIINFCMEYTRPNDSHNNLETPYWKYCIDTGVPLVPTSIYSIASLYNLHSGNMTKFQEKLEILKKEVGILSEDGAYVIDKYTGFKISEIVFDYSEDYDDAGFVVKTRDILVDVDKEEQELSIKKEIMSSQESKYIRYIIGFISEKMSINLQKQVEFIVRNVIGILTSKNFSVKMKDTYLMFLTLGMIVCAIQTSIPNIVSKKTFPNCKERFVGFPITGNESDTDAIEYVACVISYAKQSSLPWKVLTKFDVKGMVDLIKKVIIDFILPITEVQSKLNEKISYALTNKDAIVIPEEHNIKRWSTYLPPLQKIEIDQVRNITREVLIQISAKPNTESIDLIRSKLYQYALGIQSKIQRIIKKKANTALLKTSLNIPFVENSCCIDHTPNSVVGYFEKEDSTIKTYISISNELTQMLYFINTNNRSLQLYSLVNTKRVYPDIGNSITEGTIYAAFIAQMKEDIINDVGKIPEDENSSSSSSSTKKEEKTIPIKVFDSLEENITRLKDSGISYTKTDFERLMMRRFEKGIISPEEIYTPHKRTLLVLAEELENMGVIANENPEEPQFLPNRFIESCLSTIRNKKSGLSAFKTYLNDENKKMLNRIKAFMKNTKSPMLKHIDGVLDNFVTPEIFLEMMTNFIKNMTQVYPSIIINKKNKDVMIVPVPKYWDLSSQHELDLSKIILEKYSILEKNYEVEGLSTVLLFMKDNSKSFMSIVDKMGIYYQESESNKLQNPEQTAMDLPAVGLLFKYFFYITYIQYLTLGENVDGKVVPPKIISSMLDSFLEEFLNQKAIINKEMKEVADSVIYIKNIEKNRMLDELSKLTSDEHQSNKVLKALKLKRWSTPKNLRSYTKSGYDKDEGIFDEDDAFRFSAEEDGGYDEEDTGENSESFAYDLDQPDEYDEDIAFDFDLEWKELIGEDGDAIYEDGDYLNVDIEELNKE